MINKQKTKVLYFAEVDSDFADVLLSFLTLPLGKIVRVLKKRYGEDQESPVNIGSLTTLYDGLANLDSVHFFSTEVDKQTLLNPISSFDAELGKLKLDVSDSKSTKYFTCGNWHCVYSRSLNISIHCDTGRCLCGSMMNREVIIINKSQVDNGGGGCGVFTMNKVSFLISDDLRMLPNVAAVPIVQTLRNLGITDTDGAELRNVTFGFSEKSTNKLLFAQAGEDFVDFLVSLLTIPLGGVECLLGGNTCLTSMDNLYASIADLINEKYLASPDIKHKLMNPKLPQGYMSKKQILPLSEQVVLYYCRENNQYKDWLSYSSAAADPVIRYAEGNYVKGPKMYMVSDDLTVTPSSMSSTISVLNELKVSLSDIEEVEVCIGLQEGLSILKASLTSTSALTNGLKISPSLSQQPIAETLNLNFVACTYAALVLRDDGMDVTAEKIETLLKAANFNVESYWPSLFAKLCEKRNIEESNLGFGLFD
ncbi:hypothetical protein ACP275_13G041400 [Erythranthe tilingii]